MLLHVDPGEPDAAGTVELADEKERADGGGVGRVDDHGTSSSGTAGTAVSADVSAGSAARGERRPQVMRRVRAPRAPAFGPCAKRRGVVREAERRGGPTHPEVVREQHVRVAERAERDVAGRPRTDPGESSEPAERGFAVDARVEHERPVGERRRERADGSPTRRGHRQARIGRTRDPRRLREQVGQAAARRSKRRSRGQRQAPGDRAGGDDRDLLSEHRPDRELRTVDRPGRPAPRRRADQPPEHRVAAQHVIDRDRVGVEVEQPAHARDRGPEVPRVAERRAGTGRQCRRRPPRRSRARGAVEACVGTCRRRPPRHPGWRADRGTRAGCEVERRATGQPNLHAVRHVVFAAAPAPFAEQRRARVEDLADRGVELAQRGEPGRERDLRDRQVGRLEQQPGDVGTLRTGQRQRRRAEVGQQDPPELSLPVAEPARETRDALALDDAVGHQAHRPAGHVAADVPFRRAGHGARDAALAGPEARRLRRRGRRVEPGRARVAACGPGSLAGSRCRSR